MPCDIHAPGDGVDGYGPLEFLAGADHAELALEIHDAGGVVDGTWGTVDDGSVPRPDLFSPAEPLAPNTTFTSDAGDACLDAGTFTTSEVGTPVTDPEAFEGQTSPGTVCRWPEDCPVLGGSAGAPALVTGLANRAPFVDRIDDIDTASGRVDLTLGGAEGGRDEPGSQEACSETARHTGEWAADSCGIVRGERLSWAFAPIIGAPSIMFKTAATTARRRRRRRHGRRRAGVRPRRLAEQRGTTATRPSRRMIRITPIQSNL